MQSTRYEFQDTTFVQFSVMLKELHDAAYPVGLKCLARAVAEIAALEIDLAFAHGIAPDGKVLYAEVTRRLMEWGPTKATSFADLMNGGALSYFRLVVLFTASKDGASIITQPHTGADELWSVFRHWALANNASETEGLDMQADGVFAAEALPRSLYSDPEIFRLARDYVPDYEERLTAVCARVLADHAVKGNSEAKLQLEKERNQMLREYTRWFSSEKARPEREKELARLRGVLPKVLDFADLVDLP